MRHISKYYAKLKLKHYYAMAKFCLSKADKYIEGEEFWVWMDKYGKYSSKYFELYREVELR